MNNRCCTRCKITKDFSEFNKAKLGKFGLKSQCKLCEAELRKSKKHIMDEYNKEYYKRHAEKLKAYQKEYLENNRELVAKRKADYYLRVKDTKIKAYRERNADRIKLYMKIYRERNIDKIREYMLSYLEKYYAKNRDKLVHQKRLSYHADVESTRKKQRQYRKNNRAIYNAANSRRRASLLQRTPVWLTKEDLQEIAEYYKLSKYLESLNNEKYHVDHIVPLQGDNVCGLHVPWNLQILTAKENLVKSNKQLDTKCN